MNRQVRCKAEMTMKEIMEGKTHVLLNTENGFITYCQDDGIAIVIKIDGQAFMFRLEEEGLNRMLDEIEDYRESIGYYDDDEEAPQFYA